MKPHLTHLAGLAPAAPDGESVFRPTPRGPVAVGLSAELRRIQKLPRRKWENRFADGELAALATEELKSASGTMSLRSTQAAALIELSEVGGLLAPVGCGIGKTLISLLAPTALGLPGGVLLVPGALVEKTRRDFGTLAEHWDVDPSTIHVVSYQKLGRVSAEGLLDELAPAVVIADECHYLKNPRAARTKRVLRFLRANPDTVFAGMSGTITGRSLEDYAHLLDVALGADASPLPVERRTLLEWGNAVDEWGAAKEATTIRLDPGALRHLYDDEAHRLHADGIPLAAVRRAVRQRVDETPGVVGSHDDRPGPSLVIRERTAEYPEAIENYFADMRNNWTLPAGLAHLVEVAPGVEVTDTFIGPMDLWRHARELALFGCYRWKEPGPLHWMRARSEWSRVVRELCQRPRLRLDSPFAVVQAILRGDLDGMKITKDGEPLHEGTVPDVYEAWALVKSDFEPETEPHYLHDVGFDFARDWMASDGGLVFVEHRGFGLELARRTGAPYFASQGLDADGRFIDDWKPADGPAIASIASNSTGRNLQAWSAALVMSPPPQGKTWEQLLARLHRSGQLADAVTFDVFIGCLEQRKDWTQARSDAQYIGSGGQNQRLTYATILDDSRIRDARCARYGNG